MQLDRPFGFGAGDLVEIAFAAVVVLLSLAWRPWPFKWQPKDRPLLWMTVFAVLPVGLRLAMLHLHPVPVPDIYDEFGHLFVADTLRHWRLANPAHGLPQFFETFFILQEPTYSSIYPLGQGLALALGWAIFGLPWAGVLMAGAAFCGLCYWMLRGWVTPGWALVGGLLAAMEFGPLNQWTNSYWGGSLAAAGGCLVFGALPRLRAHGRLRDAVLLGIGIGVNVLTRPYESVFLVASVLLFRLRWRTVLIAGLVALPALGITLLGNKRITGDWMTLPYSLSQYQYGVPATLTFQANAVPHRALTPQQEMDYKMQLAFRNSEHETVSSYLQRLLYRTRYYRFYFYPPLYIALLAFLVRNRDWWLPGTVLLFALGTNFFPAFQYHYLAAIVCLFVLMSVRGLEALPGPAARALVFLCVAQFAWAYGTGSIAQTNPQKRIEVANDVAAIKGKLLIFVRYLPGHIFQQEWVYNAADIDASRVVWARDLGEPGNRKLRQYYPDRKVLLLEPDTQPPTLTPYVAEAPQPEPARKPESKPPQLILEQVK